MKIYIHVGDNFTVSGLLSRSLPRRVIMADDDYFDDDELGYFYVEDAYAIAVCSLSMDARIL